MFFEYSSNIALRSLEFGKRSTFVIVKSYTFNTKANFSSKNFFKNIFFKLFPKCYLDARNIATLREHSANIPGIHSWDTGKCFPIDELIKQFWHYQISQKHNCNRSGLHLNYSGTKKLTKNI